MAKKNTSLSFTKGYEELENIVADFESRELDLEKDLPKFERGLELASTLQKRLKEIENKVMEIERKFTEDDTAV
ncbi:MAG: exodeoxyribonuclease VII small subunit [Acidobacteriota bacterium]